LAPAEKARASPVRTATRAESSASKATKASWRRWAVSVSTALRTWSWSMRTTTTPSGSEAEPIARTVAGGTVGGVRVIAGSVGGRRLVAPDGASTRPTPERVREATFNALGSLGAVVDATVLDLYAGSGAMGIEALSRGASRVTFVDHDLAARRAIETNLASCGFGAAADVVATPVDRFLSGAQQRRWDLALVDPPYDFDGWPELLLELPARLAVLESGRPVEPPFGWEVRRAKRYGRTHVAIVERIAI
jgi:16S rRNA (guanine966-N2)-methyltransferase